MNDRRIGIFAGGDWCHDNKVTIHAGSGALDSLRDVLPETGHVLLVTTKGSTSRGLTARVEALCASRQRPTGKVSVVDEVLPNPDLLSLVSLTQRLASSEIDLIVGVGGGSVIDTAKVLSVILPLQDASGTWTSRLLISGDQGWKAHIPVIAIPTTAGTGAEVTPFATVWDMQRCEKLSVHGALVAPMLALLDPDLTLSLPHNETLYPGLDTISHAFESLWNRNRTPISAAHATQALSLAINAMSRLAPDAIASEGLVRQARADMLYASTLAGLAISRTKTALAHAISYPFTAHFGVPHGLACSFVLPELIVANRELLVRLTNRPDMLDSVLDFLKQIGLAKRLLSHLPPSWAKELSFENLDPDRAGNFSGSVNSSAADLVLKSISQD